MELFGELMLILFGIGAITWSLLALVVSTAFGSTKERWLCTIPLFIGVYMIYIAINCGPLIIQVVK